jgi:predicted nucleic acid-binding protein
MKILLDTSILIDLSKGKLTLPTTDYYYINPIVYSEMLYGVLIIKKSEDLLVNFLKELEVSTLPITIETASISTRIKLHLSREGNRIPDNDILIAASCIEHDLELMTLNKKHFKRISGLVLHAA